MQFEFFDRTAEIDIHSRNLPHWFQAGVATFITFRTADSMPRAVVLRWQRELENWLNNSSLPTELAYAVTHAQTDKHQRLLDSFTPSQQKEFKRYSARIWHRCLDECHGQCVLRRPELAKIAADGILFYNEKKYELDRFVIMPNHVHALVQFRPGESLKVVGQSWMRYTARLINAALNSSGSFWQPEPFDHLVRSPEQFDYIQKYVADNPRKAKLNDGEFVYWQSS